ncbi:MAG: type II toxin-antitoxin system RelE/ParE family toxin [Bryobacteraceae bacterium]
MKRRFLLTPEARADLQEILLDIATDRPDAAERLRAGIFKALQRLGRSPGIGHFHDELLDRRCRFWNFSPYVVCYLWKEKPIQIIAVVHGARHLAAFLAARINPK